jgi:hypothetical protein
MFEADDPKTWANLIIGFVLIGVGIIPLLEYFGVISFTLPGFITSLMGIIVYYVIAAVGFWLIIDGFMEEDMMRVVTIVIALVFVAIGIIQVLSGFGIIGFSIPFLPTKEYSIIHNAIFVIEGFFLILAAFLTW